MSIAERYSRVADEVSESAIRAGRSPSDVTLIAVSKTFPAASLLEAYGAGARHFGESYPQELRDKAPALPDDVLWHFIGRLQRNKAKYVAPYASRVHAIDSLGTVEALVARAASPTQLLIAVNTGLEAQKSGVAPADVLALARTIHARQDVGLRGLMCIPPRGEDPEPHFASLAALAASGRSEGLPLTELSMGMSADYALAIKHGATWVRVGSAIFGAR